MASQGFSHFALPLVNPETSDEPELERVLNTIQIADYHESHNPKTRKRTGGNNRYTPEQRAQGARLAIEFGSATRAAEQMTLLLGREVSESTIRGFKAKYVKLAANGNGPVTAIPDSQRGRPTIVPGDVEARLMVRLKTSAEKGQHISAKSTIRMCYAILKRLHPMLYSRIKLGKSWTQSLFRRMRWARRKVTRATRAPPHDYAVCKAQFHKKIRKLVKKYNVPSQLTINIDQMGCQMVPTRNSTMAAVGSRQVAQVGKGDKRGVTAVIGSTVRGRLIPPQLIYKGKTRRCHPRFQFPDKWHITQNNNHWSTSETMMQYLNEVIIPWCKNWRKRYGLPRDQKALLILDVFRPHLDESFNEACASANILRVFVPPGCTGTLQPLDADGGVNYAIKQQMCNQFDAYADIDMDRFVDPNGHIPDSYDPDLKLSTIKPHQAEWFVNSFTAVSNNHDLIRKGWEKTGILDVYLKARNQ